MSINDEINELDQRYNTSPPSDEALINNLRLNAATRSDIQIAANWSKTVAYILIGACGLMLLLLVGAFLIGLMDSGGSVGERGSVILGLLIVGAAFGAGIYLGTRLLKYSTALLELTKSEKPYALAQFFQQQNRYWVMVGVYTIIAIAFYIIVLVLIIPITQGQSF